MAGEYPNLIGAGDTSSPQIMRMWTDPYVLTGILTDTLGVALVAYRWDMRTGSHVEVDLVAVGGNELQMPYYDNTDDHYQSVCGNDDQNMMHIIGNHHDNAFTPKPGQHYIRCNDISTPASFQNPSNWVVPAESPLGISLCQAGTDGGMYTYQYMDRLTDGTLILIHSLSWARGNSVGRCVLAWKRSGGSNWTPLPGGPTANAKIFHCSNTAPSGTEAQRSYGGTMLVEPRNGFDWFHTSGLWRTVDSTADSQQGNMYLYAKSTDFTKWYAADGTLYQYGASSYPSTTPAMPVTWFNKTAATITGLPPINYKGSLSMTLDFSGSDTTPSKPTIRVYNGDSTGANFVPGTDPAVTPWFNYTWNGTTWVRTAAPNYPGTLREFNIGGVQYVRTNQGQRINLRNIATAKLTYLGSRIITAQNSVSPTPCPCWLRDGKFVTCVPYNTVPRIYQFPSEAAA